MKNGIISFRMKCPTESHRNSNTPKKHPNFTIDLISSFANCLLTTWVFQYSPVPKSNNKEIVVVTKRYWLPFISNSRPLKKGIVRTKLMEIISVTKPLKIIIYHEDGSKDEILANHSYNENQIEWFKAGSALNLIRQKNA